MPQIHFKAGPPVWGADFYGRGNEIRQLQSQMMSSQSTLVTGMRRIGKSSLLHHVHKTSAIWDDHVPRVWLDCLTCVTLDDFANHILHSLVDQGFVSNTRRRSAARANEGIAVRLALDALGKLGDEAKRVILVINDLDSLYFRRHEVADYGVAEFLRGIIDSGHFLACACSYRRLLPDDDQRLRPPLYNVMTELPLRAFRNGEADHFLGDVSERSGDRFSADEVAFVKDLVGLAPFNLQMYGYFLFASRAFVGTSGRERLAQFSQAFDRLVQELVPHFSVELTNLTMEERSSLFTVATTGEIDSSTVTEELVKRGLLDKGEKPFRSMGGLYREWLHGLPEETIRGEIDGSSTGTGFISRISEAAVKALVEGGIKAYMS